MRTFDKNAKVSEIEKAKKALRNFSRKRKPDSNHFASGRVPDAKYISGCKCGVCPLKNGQIMCAADCRNWCKSPKVFSTTSNGCRIYAAAVYLYLCWGKMDFPVFFRYLIKVMTDIFPDIIHDLLGKPPDGGAAVHGEYQKFQTVMGFRIFTQKP